MKRLGGGISVLLNFSVKGFKVFYDEVHFTMQSNNRIKKNLDNLIKQRASGKEYSVVKSAILYGPNNAGKSCFLESIEYLTNLIKNKKTKTFFEQNLFSETKEISFKIDFIENSKLFRYELVLENKKVINEILFINEKIIFNRKEEFFSDVVIKNLYSLIGGYDDRLFVLMLPIEKYGEDVKDFQNFFDRFEFVKADHTDYDEDELKDFISYFSKLKNNNPLLKMIKNSDLYINDLQVDPSFYQDLMAQEENGQISDQTKQLLSLWSIFNFKGKNYALPFITVNSLGTQKMAIFSKKVLDALKNNKILIIDEISRGWHTILTKNLLSFFNSDINSQAQMISTSHDLLLLDDVYLFRKDQIWFVYKDSDGNYLYSLNDFKDNKENDARGNVMIRYLKGLYGALPLPTLGDIFNESN
ncbi:MAG TPA: ATP-binding protein [Acholeplasmataceae bacterium]|nr:ATP-binding protein [Acholeplasmataceae bacterium]